MSLGYREGWLRGHGEKGGEEGDCSSSDDLQTSVGAGFGQEGAQVSQGAGTQTQSLLFRKFSKQVCLAGLHLKRLKHHGKAQQ